MQQATAFGTGKVAFAHARAQMAFETAVERTDDWVVEPLIAHRDNDQVGPYTVGKSIAKTNFHNGALDQSLRRIRFMNSARVSWRVRKAPSRLLVMT